MKKVVWMAAAFLACVVLLLVARQTLLPQALSEPELSANLRQAQMSPAGRERSFALYRPEELPDEAPLMIVLHGSMSPGLSMRELSARRFDVLADRVGALVVYPDGVGKHWNDCRKTATYSANLRQIDDVAFLRELIRHLHRSENIDPDRVLITGLSNGGNMALRVAMEAPELALAYAPIATSVPIDEHLDCDLPSRPVHLSWINGTADPVNPYEGGAVQILWDDSRGTVRSTADSLALFVDLADVETGVKTALPDLDASDGSRLWLTEWPGGSHSIRLLTVEDGGHNFPSRHVDFGPMLGGNNFDLETADWLWDWFEGLR